MRPRNLLFLSVMLTGAAGTPLSAQLVDLSFDTTATFHQDYVETAFHLENGFAHFDLRFDLSRPSAGGRFARIRVTESDGGLVFDERRKLDRVDAYPDEGNRYIFSFDNRDFSNPTYHPFSETLDLTLWLTGGENDEHGVFIPPEVNVDDFANLYVYGWSPMIQYDTPGHGGFFRFGNVANNVTLQFVPVPEPSTYGLFGVIGLGLAVLGHRRRKQRDDAATQSAPE